MLTLSVDVVEGEGVKHDDERLREDGEWRRMKVVGIGSVFLGLWSWCLDGVLSFSCFVVVVGILFERYWFCR